MCNLNAAKNGASTETDASANFMWSSTAFQDGFRLSSLEAMGWQSRMRQYVFDASLYSFTGLISDYEEKLKICLHFFHNIVYSQQFTFRKVRYMLGSINSWSPKVQNLDPPVWWNKWYRSTENHSSSLAQAGEINIRPSKAF